jgi:hypothetical protein
MPLRVVPGLLWVLGIRAMATTMLARLRQPRAAAVA